MTRHGLACWAAAALAALALLGCGDDDDTGKNGGSEDGGTSHSKPIVTPGKDAGDKGGNGGSAGDDEGDETFTLGDAGMRVATCKDADDGSPCGQGGAQLCLKGECLASKCGDGFVDPALEECDDENDAAGDGCDPDCKFSCKDDSMCDDGATCNGKERCLVDHTCEAGMIAGDGAECTTDAIADGQCRQGACTPAGCGDKTVKGSEQCDDGNDVAADGCEIDCTFSCEEDADCDDGSVCTGHESCDQDKHVCSAGEMLKCSDEDECTTDSCDAVEGCKYALIDEDGDGHAPNSLTCGDDCDDRDPNRFPGNPELCDDIDHDCNGDPMPANTPTWYADCDGDTYAALDAKSVQDCEMPAGVAGCLSWTSRVPDRNDKTTYDCNDAEVQAFPGQAGWFTDKAVGTTSWEYNCNDTLDLHYATVGIPSDATCTYFGTTFKTCTGKSGWVDAKPPTCNGHGDYSYCSVVIGRIGSPSGCTRVTSDRTQDCH